MSDSYLDLTVDACHGWGYRVKEVEEGTIRISYFQYEENGKRVCPKDSSIDISDMVIDKLISAIELVREHIKNRESNA